MSVTPSRARRIAIGLALGIAVCGAGLGWAWTTLPPLDPAARAERSTLVLDRHGELLRAFTATDGRWRLPVTTHDVDPRFLALLKAFEDRRFDRHAGVDPLALARATGQMLTSGRIVSGGSTLSMQVARLLEPRAERSIMAKLRQAGRALELERRLSKDDILALYLTLAPYGGNLEGLRAASWSYLGKEPKRLTLAERALLVSLPQAPEARRPDRHTAALQAARDRVIARAVSAGLATPEEATQALAEPVPGLRRAFPQWAAHLADQLRTSNLSEGQITTTLEGRWQRQLEQLMRERVTPMGDHVSAALVVVAHETGEVRAHVGGLGLEQTGRAGAIDLAQALRSPGSALKPFVYALAFEQGIAHPQTLLQDQPNRFGTYAPENFDLTFQGTVTARQALQQSLNLPAIELLSAIGPQRLVSRLNSAGAHLALPSEGAPGLAIGLGGVGIRLTDLARLYAGLARGGDSMPLAWRRGSAGLQEEPTRLIESQAAWYVADILKGTPAPNHAASGRIAYKTGTSYGYRDAWAVGFDRKHTVAVWIGRPDNGAVPGLVSRQTAAPLLFEAFERIGIEVDDRPAPSGTLVARNGQLPPPLRHLRQDIAKTETASARSPLRIAFPPDGAVLDRAGTSPDIAVKAMGGVAPLTWLIDGSPAQAGQLRRETQLPVHGTGFTRVSVIDATGASASVVVRLQ